MYKPPTEAPLTDEERGDAAARIQARYANPKPHKMRVEPKSSPLPWLIGSAIVVVIVGYFLYPAIMKAIGS